MTKEWTIGVGAGKELDWDLFIGAEEIGAEEIDLGLFVGFGES